MMRIYFRIIRVSKPEWLTAKGPLLLACNHPNSFLDGIILTTLFTQNIYSLARGDAFRKKNYDRLLRWLHLLPVYRTSEGVENLEFNYATFNSCLNIFRQKGIVLIFSEGGCINEWHLRPLKKGTARLATAAWRQGIDLTVLPVGINYSSFRNFGKNVFINFGVPIDKQAVTAHESEGKMYLSFNQHLRNHLKMLVYEIHPEDRRVIRQQLLPIVSQWKRIVLLLPGAAGPILHAPLYFPVKWITKRYFTNDHFDSVQVCILLILYPLYLVTCFIATGVILNWVTAISVLFILPFTAWAFVQMK